jgi:hypothetical protein
MRDHETAYTTRLELNRPALRSCSVTGFIARFFTVVRLYRATVKNRNMLSLTLHPSIAVNFFPSNIEITLTCRREMS